MSRSRCDSFKHVAGSYETSLFLDTTSENATMQGELYIIDVSQAVDLDHPQALDLLREDATHVNAFFRRAGIATLTTRELFDFVVDPNINEGNMEAAIDRLSEQAASRPVHYSAEDETADNVRHRHYKQCKPDLRRNHSIIIIYHGSSKLMTI